MKVMRSKIMPQIEKFHFECAHCAKLFILTREHIVNMPESISFWICDECGHREIFLIE